MKKFKSILVALLMIMLALTGCGNSEGSDSESSQAEEKSETTEVTDQSEGTEEGRADTEAPETIRIGVSSVSEITYNAIKPVFEEMGYKTEAVMFDGNPVILEAVNSGDVDMGLGQHMRYMSTFNEENGADLAMVKPYGYYTGIGLYSNKYESVDDLPEGAQIAIMNDPQNRGIALRILANEGLIKLDESVEEPTLADITDNPKNIQIVEVEQTQSVNAINDADASAVFFTHMSQAGLDPASYIARDTDMVNYPMGPITKEKNAESDWAIAYAECFKNEDVRAEIEDALPGVFKFYESDDQVEE